MQFLVDFDRSEARPEVVLATKRRRRANVKSPIDSPTTVFYKCFLDSNRPSVTVYVFEAIFTVAK
jgi:hypothetical protein